MFDLFFEGMATFNGLLFLCGAAIFLLIAAACIGYWISWRLRSFRVKGKIVAVKSTGTRRTDEEWLDNYEGSSANDEQVKDFDEIKREYAQEFSEKPIKTALWSFAMLLLAMIPVIFFCVGAWFTYDFLSLRYAGNEAQGMVVRYEETYDSESGTSYYPVVSFKDIQGRSYTEKDKLGTGSKPYKTGEKITVFYDPDDPSHFVMDRFWRYVGFGLAFMGMGGLFIGIGVAAVVGGKNEEDERKCPKEERKKIEKLKRQHYINQHYIPVYEFRTRQGEAVQVEGSDDANNWLVDKLPGREVKLMVIPGDPPKVKRPGKAFLIIGIICAIPGLIFGKLAFSQISFGPAGLAVIAGMIGWIGYKISKSVKPRSEWGKLKDISKELGQFKVEVKNKGGYIMTPAEIKERVRILDRSSLLGMPVVLFFGIAMMFGGHHMFKDMNDLSSKAIVAQGEIVDMDMRSDSDGTMYYPVVGFETLDGERVRFRGKTGSNPPMHRTGDRVLVLYDPDRPERAIIDSGWMNWLPSVAVFLIGALMAFYSIKLLAGIMNRARRVRV